MVVASSFQGVDGEERFGMFSFICLALVGVLPSKVPYMSSAQDGPPDLKEGRGGPVKEEVWREEQKNNMNNK